MRHEPFVADISIEPGRRSTALATIGRGNLTCGPYWRGRCRRRVLLLSGFFSSCACHNLQGEPGPIDCVSTLRLSEFLMARLAWWVVGSQLITTTHTNVCSVATVRHANTTENKSRLDCSCGRALHAHVSALATYDCGRSGRDAAVSPSTAICSKRSTAESSASNSLG